jgi:hypothetical protein
MAYLFERPITSALVFHKSNPDIHFVACHFDSNTGIYTCRHLSAVAETEKSIVLSEFYHGELEILEIKPHYRKWSEFDIVFHRTNPNIKLITLVDLPERGKTKCRWITLDLGGSINTNEYVFDDFELVLPESLDIIT